MLDRVIGIDHGARDGYFAVIASVDRATGTITIERQWRTPGVRWSKRYARRARMKRKHRRGWP